MAENKDLLRLIAGCRRMEEVSQMELYRQFYNYGMSISLRYSSNRESALEILNDGFLKVFLKIDQYKTESSFKPWLRRILINASIDYYRKYEQKKNPTLEIENYTNSSHNIALDKLAFDDLKLIMQTLPAAYRMAFNLYVVEGYSHAEIAKELNINIGTSKSNLSKARRKIKELLKSSLDIHLKTH